MTDKPDMISRKDVTEILFDEGWYGNTLSRVDALPAAQVAVKPLEWRQGWGGEDEDVPRWHGLAADGFEYGFSAAGYGYATHDAAPVEWVDEQKAARERANVSRIRSALIAAPAQVADRAQTGARVSGLAALPRFSGYDVMMGQDGFDPQPTPDGVWVRFADVTALIPTQPAVSDDVAARIAEAVAAERERCAKIAEDERKLWDRTGSPRRDERPHNMSRPEGEGPVAAALRRNGFRKLPRLWVTEDQFDVILRIASGNLETIAAIRAEALEDRLPY